MTYKELISLVDQKLLQINKRKMTTPTPPPKKQAN